MIERQLEKKVVGIDVSKETLHVYGLSQAKSEVYKNHRSGIKQIVAALKKDEKHFVVFEPTGGYEKPLVRALQEAQIATHLADATKVHHFAQSRGREAKTDRLDAQLLATYGAQVHIQARPLPTQTDYECRELFARLEQLKGMIVQEKNRVQHNYVCAALKTELNQHLVYLEKAAARVEKKIDDLLSADETVRALQARLQTVKGIGPKVSRLLVARLPELGKANRQEIVRLVGVAPRIQQSGKKEGKKPPRGGRTYVRQLLFLATMIGIRYNPVLKAHYEHLLARGKIKMVALIAIVRKLVIHLNTIAKQFYQEQEKNYAVN